MPNANSKASDQTTEQPSKLPSEQDIISRLQGTPAEVAAGLRAAAEQGFSDAQALLGQILLDGQGITQNQTEALAWFQRAAESGHVMAINMVGRCLENGWGVYADPTAAASWYQRASDLGLDWGMYNYANLLARGTAIPQNRTEAFRLYNAAAAMGHAKSMNIVGRFIEEGWETARDAALAFDWYRRSAEAGDFRGQFNYASKLAEQGKEIEAAAWLRECASTATPGFRNKIAQVLLQSAKSPFVKIAAEILSGHDD